MTTKFKIFVFILSAFLSDNSPFAQQDDSCFCQAVRSQDVSVVENIGCADERLSMLKLLTLVRRVACATSQTVVSDSLRNIAIECERAFSWYFGDNRFIKLGIYAYHTIGNWEDVARLMPMLGDDESLADIIESIDKTLGR